MKRKSRLGRGALSTPKLTIRRDLPWPARALMWTCAVGLGAGAAWLALGWLGHAPRFPQTGSSQGPDLGEQVEQLTAERERLATAANAAEARLNIERAAQAQLLAQARAQEKEISRLKEDLAFYESLLPTATGPAGITIRRFKAELAAPNQIRYQALVMQGGKGQQEFLGSLQLALTVTQDGKPAMMVFPEARSPENEQKYKLRFKHYQRLDGILTLPPGVTVRTVQARVLEKGQTRAQQAVDL